jgi:hypothetical protein
MMKTHLQKILMSWPPIRINEFKNQLIVPLPCETPLDEKRETELVNPNLVSPSG